jgi:DNA-binding SARP family transcriptional activator
MAVVDKGAPNAQLFLLGRFELRIGGRVVVDRTFQRTKAKSLIKLLALQFGGMMHRDQVIEALWPNVRAPSAANNLHKSMHFLRAAASEPASGDAVSGDTASGDTASGDGIVTIRDAMVVLRNDIWIDAHAFVNQCLAARTARSIDGFSAALALYRGELLPDDLYEPWAERHRENLRALFISSSLDLCALHEERHEWREALERASTALQADPTTEETHRVLMRLFARSGNTSRALQQYEQCREILRRELDIEPGERTRALRDSIRAGVSRAPRPEPDVDLPLPVIQQAYAADGARVAFWTLGHGEGMPLVSMPWLPHTDIAREWQIKEWRAHSIRLADQRRFIRYDCRAVGASRPGTPNFSIGAAMAEIDAVADEARLDRFALWASFHSGTAAITYAVRRPERVAALVLWCCYARGRDLREREELRSLRRMLTADWHVYSESAAQFFFAWEHQRIARQYAALIRDSSDAETSREFIRTAYDYDASDLLRDVRAPTLVLHRREMPWTDVSFSEELARCIPGAQLRIVEGACSAPFVEGASEIGCMVNEFLTQTVKGSAP